MKFAICNEIFDGWKLEDTASFVARTGYDGLELAPFTLANHVTDISPGERRRIRETVTGAGIVVSGIHWVLVKAEGMHLTHPDAAIRERTATYFGELVDFCADVGGGYIVVGSPKQRSIEPGVTHEQAWTWAADVFRDAVKKAEDRAVTICFEPLAPAETNFINTAGEAIRFTREVKSPNFRIILDVKAMCAETKPIPQIIRESWPDFTHFHANDRNLKGPGFGDVDFRPIVAALREVGYDAWVSVEVFKFEEGPEVIATKSLEYLKEVFGTADRR